MTTEPTLTIAYARAHEAFNRVAREFGLAPFDVRLLVALADHDGQARTDELEQAMVMEGTAIRRSSLALRLERLITADAGDGTTQPRRGTRARLTLTGSGWIVANEARRLAERGPEHDDAEAAA